VIAVLLEDGETAADIGAAPKAPAPEPKAPAQEALQTPKEAPTPVVANPASMPTPSQSGDRVKASPLAKRMAEQGGLQLAKISGTGPNGRIVKRDVEAAIQAGPVASTPDTSTIQPGGFDLVPLDGMRKTIARRLTDSFRDVPHFPLNIDCHLDALLATRKAINTEAAEQGIKISVNDFIVRAVALALKKVPEANASYTPDGLKLWHNADVAIAVAIDGGLITPVIFAAQDKGLADISALSKDLAGRARARKLLPEEYQGGTFTVSNLGMMGIKSFASILNQPQGCILSVGAGEPRPVVSNGELAVATVMTVTLTCDHRVVDGAIGARFLAAFKAMIENPGLMLL
jgi:pyruvate dehydrogenase E2 component (dihydrolipoamide acetyltransferase)